MQKPIRLTALCCSLAVAAPALADDEEIANLQAQLDVMQAKIEALEENAEPEKPENDYRVGGAVRFNYVYEDYNASNKRRGGEMALDIFRIDFDANIGDVLLSAEYRFYDYMDALHHAWVGYQFTDTLQAQVGVNQVPFGILPYASHSYFFSSNYYLGLEDDNDFGIKVIHDDGPLNLQAAFYFNDEMGGSTSNDSYSYDIIGMAKQGEEVFDAEKTERATALDNNITNLRAAWTFGHGTDYSTEVGVSGQYGGMVDDDGRSVGDQYAYAAHLVGNYGPWNIQLQAARYDYKVGGEWDRMIVGAYAFDDTIATRASVYTANVAYNLPVNWGPVTHLTFYNDHSYTTDKSHGIEDTWANVTGVSVTAGGVFAYFDIFNGKNHPFNGGTMGNKSGGKHNTRYNINVGYYF